MGTLLNRLDAHLPFNKTERTIILIVLLMHCLPLLSLLKFHFTADTPDEERVAVNLVSPAAAPPAASKPVTPPPKPATPPTPPSPKPQPKEKMTQDKSSQTPKPPQTQQQSSPPAPQSSQQAPSSTPPNGTPIQTDIGKLEVVYEPDADAYYPSFSKRSGEQGAVVVRLIIDQAGNVEDVALLRSSNFPRLDRAAEEIGQRYRFKPYLVNGVPSRISTNLLIKFNLKN
ncbi:energy transducer TonB [Polynucleobacter paneuropaeus]|uniref:energy transducer TonB n=1 Tax=Polynucleobacter paneuropaeus TaxID=2527775 RepID=UPI001BFD881A|nr:energy transducer TonB [Polynucleobacter paneuropaeus]MBT8631673.1 energy transducer TonB [Polynucleobacter paneuropaeus]